MAIAAEVERRHTDAGGDEAADLHKAMVEQALHGYDVQLSAVHFAATSSGDAQPGYTVRPHESLRDASGRGRLEYIVWARWTSLERGRLPFNSHCP